MTTVADRSTAGTGGMALPPLFVTQDAVRENGFSKHDNRHSFQNCGVYFGQGLGKRPVSQRRNQHGSANHTSWTTSSSGTDPHTQSTTYSSDFHLRLRPQDPLPKLTGERLTHKFQVFTKSTFHRFPRSHLSPHIPPAPPLSRLATWFPHEHPRGPRGGTSPPPTPLVVLAESQKPFLPHNPWAYSYRS